MSMRTLRACMVCSIVLPSQTFQRNGCPNCEDFLDFLGTPDAFSDCTSAVFEGLITLAEPQTSWVAKWQRLTGYIPGTYAVKVVGILSEEFIDKAESAGVDYIPRDGSGTQDEQ